MTIRFIQQWNGHSPDEVNSSLGSTEEARLVGLNIASYDLDGANDGAEEFVKAKRNPVTGGIDFSGMLMGNLANGAWFNPPSIFRLLLNGTGTVTLASKDAAGNITTGVYSATLTNAVNQIDYPYAGDGAIQIRATLTGTATAKVI